MIFIRVQRSQQEVREVLHNLGNDLHLSHIFVCEFLMRNNIRCDKKSAFCIKKQKLYKIELLKLAID